MRKTMGVITLVLVLAGLITLGVLRDISPDKPLPTMPPTVNRSAEGGTVEKIRVGSFYPNLIPEATDYSASEDVETLGALLSALEVGERADLAYTPALRVEIAICYENGQTDVYTFNDECLVLGEGEYYLCKNMDALVNSEYWPLAPGEHGVPIPGVPTGGGGMENISTDDVAEMTVTSYWPNKEEKIETYSAYDDVKQLCGLLNDLDISFDEPAAYDPSPELEVEVTILYKDDTTKTLIFNDDLLLTDEGYCGSFSQKGEEAMEALMTSKYWPYPPYEQRTAAGEVE